jgi:hypothetical protein
MKSYRSLVANLVKSHQNGYLWKRIFAGILWKILTCGDSYVGPAYKGLRRPPVYPKFRCEFAESDHPTTRHIDLARPDNPWLTSIGKGGEKDMSLRTSRTVARILLLAVALMAAACAEKKDGGSSPDPELANRGSIEVTAKLVEIPEGAIFDRPLYNYATVLKYEVVEVHRGRVKGKNIYVGHYNPAKPRSEVADRRVPDVGGTLKSFKAGDVHRMALEEPMLESSAGNGHFYGGVLNKYSEEDTDPIYWAVYTVLVNG